jgi:hypothetical protein
VELSSSSSLSSYAVLPFPISRLITHTFHSQVLDAYSGFSWRRAWEKALILKSILISRAETSGSMTADEAQAVLAPALDALNNDLRFFGQTQRAAYAVYVVSMLVLLAVNFGGLSLLYVLRKQIKYVDSFPVLLS